MSHRCANVSPCGKPTCNVCNVDVPNHIPQHDDRLQHVLHKQAIRRAEDAIVDQTDELERLHAELKRLRHRKSQLLLQQDQWRKRWDGLKHLYCSRPIPEEVIEATWMCNVLRNHLRRLSGEIGSVLSCIDGCEAYRERVEKRLDALVAG